MLPLRRTLIQIISSNRSASGKTPIALGLIVNHLVRNETNYVTAIDLNSANPDFASILLGTKDAGYCSEGRHKPQLVLNSIQKKEKLPGELEYYFQPCFSNLSVVYRRKVFAPLTSNQIWHTITEVLQKQREFLASEDQQVNQRRIVVDTGLNLPSTLAGFDKETIHALDAEVEFFHVWNLVSALECPVFGREGTYNKYCELIAPLFDELDTISRLATAKNVAPNVIHIFTPRAVPVRKDFLQATKKKEDLISHQVHTGLRKRKYNPNLYLTFTKLSNLLKKICNNIIEAQGAEKWNQRDFQAEFINQVLDYLLQFPVLPRNVFVIPLLFTNVLRASDTLQHRTNLTQKEIAVALKGLMPRINDFENTRRTVFQ